MSKMSRRNMAILGIAGLATVGLVYALATQKAQAKVVRPTVVTGAAPVAEAAYEVDPTKAVTVEATKQGTLQPVAVTIIPSGPDQPTVEQLATSAQIAVNIADNSGISYSTQLYAYTTPAYATPYAVSSEPIVIHGGVVGYDASTGTITTVTG